MKMGRKFKDLWMAFVHVFGRVQTTVLLAIVYHLAVGPIALICRLVRKELLRLQPPPSSSYASEVPQLSVTPERARRQF
jgi:hypothetical protein